MEDDFHVSISLGLTVFGEVAEVRGGGPRGSTRTTISLQLIAGLILASSFRCFQMDKLCKKKLSVTFLLYTTSCLGIFANPHSGPRLKVVFNFSSNCFRFC